MSVGRDEILEFELDGSQEILEFDNSQNTFVWDGEFIDNKGWTGSKIILSLATISDTIKREIIKGQKYQVLFSYQNDSEALRTNLGTCIMSGYYIVDIIKMGQKFERQVETNYNDQ